MRRNAVERGTYNGRGLRMISQTDFFLNCSNILVRHAPAVKVKVNHVFLLHSKGDVSRNYYSYSNSNTLIAKKKLFSSTNLKEATIFFFP